MIFSIEEIKEEIVVIPYNRPEAVVEMAVCRQVFPVLATVAQVVFQLIETLILTRKMSYMRK